jgi:hypothetical protein
VTITLPNLHGKGRRLAGLPIVKALMAGMNGHGQAGAGVVSVVVSLLNCSLIAVNVGYVLGLPIVKALIAGVNGYAGVAAAAGAGDADNIAVMMHDLRACLR